MAENKIRISAVKYANTYPFLFGITETGFDKKIILTTDHPAECAFKLAGGFVDIGLIPIAALPSLKEYHIITDFCLGAYGKVTTVMLLSNSPFETIETIRFDYRSKSSNNLAMILAKNAWKREFKWKDTSEGFDLMNIREKEAVVLIGDQCIEYSKLFRYRIDLAEEWYKFSGLPFAFACWTANKKLDKSFILEFNEAIAYGVNNIDLVVGKYGKTGIITGHRLKVYLTEYMDFILNDDKKKAIDLFLELMNKL